MACDYLVLRNGGNSASACDALVGRAVLSNALEEVAKLIGFSAVKYFFLGPWRSFLRDSCFPGFGPAARAGIRCSHMSCNVVYAKYSVSVP